MMDLKNSTDEKNAKVIEAIHDIFEEHEHEGAAFILAIFMNGLVNAIGMYSSNADAANVTMGHILEQLSTSVEDMAKLGVFSQSKHIQ